LRWLFDEDCDGLSDVVHWSVFAAASVTRQTYFQLSLKYCTKYHLKQYCHWIFCLGHASGLKSLLKVRPRTLALLFLY
jgi:hypothetical protein